MSATLTHASDHRWTIPCGTPAGEGSPCASTGRRRASGKCCIPPPGARPGWRALSVCCVGLVGEEVIWMYDIGEKPGVGRYCCTSCGWSVNLDDGSDRLPPCGSCGKGQQTKYNSC